MQKNITKSWRIWVVFYSLDSQTTHISLCLIQSDTWIPFQVWLKIIGHPQKKPAPEQSVQNIGTHKNSHAFFGGVFPIVPIGWWVFHRVFCCQASEFGTFWFRTAPHDRSDASGHAGLGGFRKSSGFRRCIAVDFPVAQIENEAS